MHRRLTITDSSRFFNAKDKRFVPNVLQALNQEAQENISLKTTKGKTLVLTTFA